MTDYETLPDGNIRVPLSNGNWAEVRTIEDLRRADERAIFKQADADGIDLSGGTMGLDALAALQDAVAARMVRRWSLTDDEQQPLPVTAEAVQALRSRDSSPLIKATGPVLAEVMKNLGEGMDPKSVPSSPPPAAAES